MNFLVVIVSYLLGSINFAYITARIKGIDISSEGSGNPGTSNVLRTLGKGSAAIVLLGDLFKGAIPIIFFFEDQYFLVYGLAAVVGHIYPVFYKFKGGKGVATYLGVYVATVLMNPYNSDLFNIEIFQILNIPVLAFFYFVIFKTTRVLYFADKLEEGDKSILDLSLKESLTIGFAQALALFPGVSRSGITLSTALYLKLKKN